MDVAGSDINIRDQVEFVIHRAMVQIKETFRLALPVHVPTVLVGRAHLDLPAGNNRVLLALPCLARTLARSLRDGFSLEGQIRFNYGGVPYTLIDALVEQGTGDLHLISDIIPKEDKS